MGKAMMGTGEAEGEGRAAKATDMAISNPLIDDYTLKGAKGLLVNITCGDDLKLFEVDEVINKIRAEVDSEAEVITGAITDTTLDGKIRVSIVATSLDGQQPEAKSVINMVHRIQNRNPGYSDFSNMGSTQPFNFSNNLSSTITNGANALKLENEVINSKTVSSVGAGLHDPIEELNHEYNEELLKTQEIKTESIIEENDYNQHEPSFAEETLNNSADDEQQPSNGLENFGVETETLGLFNSDLENSSHDLSSLNSQEEANEEDDLEIPAFLRRQKN
jgi:cell division protein FtsZ